MIVPRYWQKVATQNAAHLEMYPEGFQFAGAPDPSAAAAAAADAALIDRLAVFFPSRAAAAQFYAGIQASVRQQAAVGAKTAVKPYVIASLAAGGLGIVLGLVAIFKRG